ncbi:ribonuclease M5 [Texcoconibacillus texcoconensis]|uniref:Ribonuclease M5 n=1 Tax=Texcoconibacillus texcoconensis TaxID=1095777 RepID=A0A840QTP0_9BACI|nr:ribonuclease M5 [Texcoconibacillus texcoconensis]MBB5174916.1 ribonuclease M5 [Texcoconibacillus texcoconensis]
MKIEEVIVVEGKDDTFTVKQAVTCETIETNGSAINDDTLTQIQFAQERRGVIVFTDPDFPGEKIRHTISKRVPGCKHAFIDREMAKDERTGKIGIEHAHADTIREALKNIHTEAAENEQVITKQDLMNAGLIAGSDAKQKREQLGRLLKIGYANGKQLHRRLQMFRIQREEFIDAVVKVMEGEDGE